MAQMYSIICKARASSEARKRITAIDWCVTVFSITHMVTLETFLLLVDDRNESVCTSASVKLGELSAALVSDVESEEHNFAFELELLTNFPRLSTDLLVKDGAMEVMFKCCRVLISIKM